MTPWEREVYDEVDRQAPNGYGLTIMKAIGEKTGREPSLGAVYVALENLEEAGWVRSQMEPGGPTRGYRSKRVYYIARRLEAEQT